MRRLRGAEKQKIRLHPLCLIVGILSAFTGRLLEYLAAVIAALEHECAHSFAARRYGYSLDKIVLMPYGAVVSGDISGIGRKEEIMVLLAGPLANLCTGLFFVALWWLYPECYPFTDTAARISFSLFFVNLLPAWPLDGGRILRALLRPIGEKRAKIVTTTFTAVIAAGVLGYFVYTCFSTPAFTALAFSLLLGVGVFGGGAYRPVRITRDFSKGVEERRIALSADRTLRDALRYLREDKYLVLVLFEGDEFLGELPEEELMKALSKGDYTLTLGACLT